MDQQPHRFRMDQIYSPVTGFGTHGFYGSASILQRTGLSETFLALKLFSDTPEPAQMLPPNAHPNPSSLTSNVTPPNVQL